VKFHQCYRFLSPVSGLTATNVILAISEKINHIPIDFMQVYVDERSVKFAWPASTGAASLLTIELSVIHFILSVRLIVKL
jgi:hypothetical protein